MSTVTTPCLKRGSAERGSDLFHPIPKQMKSQLEMFFGGKVFPGGGAVKTESRKKTLSLFGQESPRSS